MTKKANLANVFSKLTFSIDKRVITVLYFTSSTERPGSKRLFRVFSSVETIADDDDDEEDEDYCGDRDDDEDFVVMMLLMMMMIAMISVTFCRKKNDMTSMYSN